MRAPRSQQPVNPGSFLEQHFLRNWRKWPPFYYSFSFWIRQNPQPFWRTSGFHMKIYIHLGDCLCWVLCGRDVIWESRDSALIHTNPYWGEEGIRSQSTHSHTECKPCTRPAFLLPPPPDPRPYSPTSQPLVSDPAELSGSTITEKETLNWTPDPQGSDSVDQSQLDLVSDTSFIGMWSGETDLSLRALWGVTWDPHPLVSSRSPVNLPT